MAIAHAEQFSAPIPGSTTAGNYDLSCAATITPNGVVVIIEQTGTGATSDLVTSVTYGISTGAVSLSRRRFDTEATEAGGVYIYWGSGTFPSGTQTVRVVRTGTANMRFVVATMTVAAGQAVAVDTDATGTSVSVANPSWTMTTTAATNTVCYEGIHSGLGTMTSTPPTTPNAWTLITSEDVTATGRGWARTTATGGSVTCGWTAATADDFVGSSIAFKEAAPPVGVGGRRLFVINKAAVMRAGRW